MSEYYNRMKEALAHANSPTNRVITFLVVLGGILREHGVNLPIVVGGAALEIYTLGQYMSHDIDLKSNFEVTMRVLREMGFKNDGRSLMYSKEFDILVDWQGGTLEEGKEAEDRVLKVNAINGQEPVVLISIEDLIVDRLEAYKYGRDKDALRWAKTLYTLGMNNSIKINSSMLKKLAEKADVADVLEEICRII